jgi:hypothetical protein
MKTALVRSLLVMATWIAGGICQASTALVGDFNADGVVDVADLRALIEHWGSHDPLYDIGPAPSGDGVVDVQDLVVLTQYLRSSPASKEVAVSDLAAQVSLDSYTKYLRDDLYTHDGDERCFGPKHDLAQQRIRQLFESFGLKTSLHRFAYKGMDCYNVVGVHPGVTCPNDIYVIGAHYDTVANCPGAWDNASGVAGVLESARVLSQHAFEATLVFIAFDREEEGEFGSTAYVRDHIEDHMYGMINLDSIAWRAYGPTHPNYNKVSLYYESKPRRFLDDIAAAVESYGGLTCVVGPLSPRYSSDHESFDDAGFAAGFLITYVAPEDLTGGWPNSTMHTPRDSVERGLIDYGYGTQVTRAVVGCLATEAMLAHARAFPDFDGDGDIDIDDCRLLVDHWNDNNVLYDIAPPPAGDGVVDVQDLDALLYYWLTDRSAWWPQSDFGLLAHWKLDETQGGIAEDSTEFYNGTLHGGATWAPAAGKLGGALRFDGVDDYISTDFILSPLAPFSVSAWVRGGAAGQVILSQAQEVNWLLVSSTGTLTTDLKLWRDKSLVSQSVVTDGNWHRAGFTWDGSHRILYVDDVEVAQDTPTGLSGSLLGMQIGTGSTLAPASFWSGLIDDVRIYNRAMKP